jgi:hypothetical protein
MQIQRKQPVSTTSFRSKTRICSADRQLGREIEERQLVAEGFFGLFFAWPKKRTSHDESMKTIACSIFLGLVIGAAPLAYAAVPAINVTVSDSGGKAAYKGATDTKGTFATGKLQPGGYVVQFNSKSAPKGSKYAMVVSAGKKKVTANAVQAEKLAAGGVAMKIDVGAGLNITGQVATEDKNSGPMGKNGKAMVWIPKKLGSNIAAHWAESDSAEAKEAMTSTNMSRQDLQNRQSQGVTMPGN